MAGEGTEVGKPPSERNPEAGWFGDTAVSPDEKTHRVRGVFERVANRYDLMNDLLSGGVHRVWKSRFVGALPLRSGMRVVDLAGGTGDIAGRIIARSRRMGLTDVALVSVDLSPEMLGVGRDRAIDRGHLVENRFAVGSAEALPLASRSVDLVTIAFGLRNVTRIDTALAEIRRVLKPGGTFRCLEFSPVESPLFGRAYAAYSDAVIPRLGRIVADDEDSYRYLVESIRRFPRADALAARMAACGFEAVGHTMMSGGIVAVHRGRRL